MSNNPYTTLGSSSYQRPTGPLPAYEDPYTGPIPLKDVSSTMLREQPVLQKQSSMDEEEEEMLRRGMVDWNALKRKDFWLDKKMISTSVPSLRAWPHLCVDRRLW